MTSTEFLRTITILFSLLVITFMLVQMKNHKSIRNILIFPLTVIINIFIRILSLFFFLPLEGVEITIYNNWNSIIVIQTILMIFFMTWYLSQKEKL